MQQQQQQPAVITAISSEKGGVGKTGMASMLAMILSLLRYRVLAIDVDPQGHLGHLYGYPRRTIGPNIYDVLRGAQNAHGQTLRLQDVILRTAFHPTNLSFLDMRKGQPLEGAPHPGPDIVPINLDATNADYELKAKYMYWNELLSEALEPLVTRYDYILIDCPPSLGTLCSCALTAADYVLIPVVPEPLAIEGLFGLLGVVELARKKANPRLAVAGIFLNKVQNWLAHNEITAEMHKAKLHNIRLFSTEVKQNASFAASINRGSLIVLDNPENENARAYYYLLAELLDVIGGRASPDVADLVRKMRAQDDAREIERQQRKLQRTDGTAARSLSKITLMSQ